MQCLVVGGRWINSLKFTVDIALSARSQTEVKKNTRKVKIEVINILICPKNKARILVTVSYWEIYCLLDSTYRIAPGEESRRRRRRMAVENSRILLKTEYFSRWFYIFAMWLVRSISLSLSATARIRFCRMYSSALHCFVLQGVHFLLSYHLVHL